MYIPSKYLEVLSILVFPVEGSPCLCRDVTALCYLSKFLGLVLYDGRDYGLRSMRKFNVKHLMCYNMYPPLIHYIICLNFNCRSRVDFDLSGATAYPVAKMPRKDVL